ncbi:MAG: catalase family protein [Bauldia sp.]
MTRSLGKAAVLAACVALAGGSAMADPSPDQEVVPATEAADTEALVKLLETAVGGAYAMGVRPAMRDAHAKGHGCVKGYFAVAPDLPEPLRKGVFAELKTYTAWIRFSNGSGTPHDDSAGDGRGMAIKLTGVPGKKLLASEADAQTQDFVMINYPVFAVRDVANYLPLIQLTLQGKAIEFLEKHPHEGEITRAITSITIDQVLEQQYFSMSPYILGDQYIKFTARPIDCTTGATIVESTDAPPKKDPNYLREGMIKWLDRQDACFKFAVQPQTDPATQLIEDATSLWDEAKAPFIDVATLRIPIQKFDSEAQMTFCENLSYTPWHALPEQRPAGGINRMRRAVYDAISELRHRLNKAPRVEPTGNETFN